MYDWISLLGSATFAVILRLAVLAALTFVGLRLIDLGRRVFQERVVNKADDPSRQARLVTLLDASVRTGQLLLIIAVVLMALMALGINIGPALAAAGVAGLAVSLGAQSIIKDFLGGVFILIEDQFRVGDVIRVEDTEGGVERISLRTTSLRDGDGKLWIIPNGDIRIFSNSTRDWARAVVDINLSLTADVAQAVAVLESAMARAAAEPSIGEHLLEAPVVEGWTGINDWAIQVRVRVMTKAGQQWGIARNLRQKALEALREAGIPVASRAFTRDETAEAA